MWIYLRGIYTIEAATVKHEIVLDMYEIKARYPRTKPPVLKSQHKQHVFIVNYKREDCLEKVFGKLNLQFF